MVQRYDPDITMTPADDGDYVEYEDYERLKEALEEIEAVSCGEKQIQNDGVYDDGDGMLWIYKRIQALKDAEKK